MVEEPDDECGALVEREEYFVRDAIDGADGACGADAAGAFDDYVFWEVRALEDGLVEVLNLDGTVSGRAA